MKNVVGMVIVVISLLFAVDASACATCIARQCQDGPPDAVCDQIDTRGCISSGVCTSLMATCVEEDLMTRLARVEIEARPNTMMIAPRYALVRTLRVIRDAATANRARHA